MKVTKILVTVNNKSFTVTVPNETLKGIAHELRQEVATRYKVYPRLVRDGKMTEVQMQRKISRMQGAYNIIAALASAEEQQGGDAQ